MADELESDGVRLRRPSADTDAGAALELFTDPDVVLWNPAPSVVDLDSAAAWCRRNADWSSGDHATFSVVSADTGALTGTVSIHRIDTEHGTAEIGYRIHPSARGRGVGTAAVRGATTYAFETLGLHRVTLVHSVENVASCRVAAKAGYLLEATLRSAGVYAGARHDEHLHSRLRSDP